jgi:hypothetical protein
MVFCPKCGNAYAGNPNFCERCGAMLSGTGVESPQKAKPQSSVEEICRGFYDRDIFNATVRDIDVWSEYLDTVFKHAAEADPSFARVDRSQFQREMTALRVELFGLAWADRFKGDEEVLAQFEFAKRYLEQIGRSDIWPIMRDYSAWISLCAGSDAKMNPRRKAEVARMNALRAKRGHALVDSFMAKDEAKRGHALIDAIWGEEERIVSDLSKPENEQVQCISLVCDLIGADVSRFDSITFTLLVQRLSIRLGFDKPTKALGVLSVAIFGFYGGAVAYLKGV